MSTAIVNKRHTRSQRIPKSIWMQIREAYERGEGSCRQLAEKYGLNPWAVSNRCKRERWRDSQAKLEQKLAKRLDQSLDKQAQSMAEQAAALVQRSVTEGFAWLDQVEKARQLLDAGDIPALRDLVGCWKSLIEVSRKTFRLDDTPGRAAGIDVELLSRPFVVVEVDTTPPPDSHEPLRLTGAAASEGESEPLSSEP